MTTRPRDYVCAECGYTMFGFPEKRWQGIDPPHCPNHPTSTLIEWTNQLVWAMNYIERAARAELDLDKWVDTVDAAELRVTRLDLVNCKQWARKWQRSTFVEAPLLKHEAPTPSGLFGGQK